MAPATRTIASTSNNEDGGVNERLSGRNPNQQQFTRMTKMDFLKFSRDDVKGEIRKVKYQPNAKEYQDAFDTLLSRVDISEEHAVIFYLGGLPAEIEIRYTPGHKCSGKLYSLVVLADEDEEYFETMRVTGKVGKHEIHILVDCGSTHNFLDDSVAKRVGCSLKDTCPLAVTVGGGKELISTKACKDFVWQLQGETFKGDMMVLPLGGCEMVLGIQWLATLGDIKCNFSQLKMEFVYNKRRMVLMGAPRTTLQWMEGKHQEKEMERVLHAELLMLSVFPNTDAIEAMVKELLEARVIKASNSLFASLIVMVKKKDNTWRICVDYRQLNKNIVKDKFPIPIIKELIDELHGVAIFSKLDLRSAYHQIRMCEEDIAKTAFKTHEGHYEFLVMPFGLTIAPSTFQALMNEVFKAFLRKFTLVFFDDILVYSQTMEEHVTHLQLVLETMREHKLYAKMSKCVFGTTHVEYLGNVISKKGVSTEPNKVRAMQDWPIQTTLKQLRGFLGLTGYYRRFIKGFASLSRPLTQLLKKNAFKWNSEAQLSFEALKKAMVEVPNLGLPDFNEPFVIETYASGVGLGAMLQQKGHPIAYLSKTLSPKHQSLSTYEKRIFSCYNGTRKMERLGSGNELLSMFVSSITIDLMKKVQDTWLTDDAVGAIITNLRNGQPAKQHYAWVNDKLLRKGKLVVGQDANLRREMLKYFHDDSIGEGLSKSHDKDVIMVIVNRLSEYVHFIALSHPFNAAQIAQVFLDSIYKLHGMPELIVSDRDKVFISAFWKELFRALKVKLHMSTAYHPQTDGQTKVVNRCLEGYLRCMTGEQPKKWFEWPSLAELWYNTNFHTSINTTPFEVVYGQAPPIHVPYLGGLSKVDAVDRTLLARDEAIQVHKFHLQRLQNRMKQQADKSRFEREYVVGDMVGQAAYKLKLPIQAQIHNVFHVSQLKKYTRPPLNDDLIALPQCDTKGSLLVQPIKLLDRKMVKKHNKVVVYGLVQWANGTVEDASWENLGKLVAKFPEFDLSS
ncbi:transposon ty3-G gag-pol polyprotein [Tanacetum coccineum]